MIESAIYHPFHTSRCTLAFGEAYGAAGRYEFYHSRPILAAQTRLYSRYLRGTILPPLLRFCEAKRRGLQIKGLTLIIERQS